MSAADSKPLDLEQFAGFTPGPWKMRREDGHGRAKIGVESDLRRTVAAVSGVDWPENAGLIEAAPALLAECRRQREEIARLRATLTTNNELLEDFLATDYGEVATDKDCREQYHDLRRAAYDALDAARAALAGGGE